MKLSISLTEADVAALDDYVARAGLTSRSAAVQHAIRRLGDPGLEDAYAEAWKEWDASDDAASWASTRGDGLTRAAW